MSTNLSCVHNLKFCPQNGTSTVRLKPKEKTENRVCDCHWPSGHIQLLPMCMTCRPCSAMQHNTAPRSTSPWQAATFLAIPECSSIIWSNVSPSVACASCSTTFFAVVRSSDLGWRRRGEVELRVCDGAEIRTEKNISTNPLVALVLK